jgi:secondary thiamine-phosphate synthase enzyme
METIKSFFYKTTSSIDIIDITRDIQDFVRNSEADEGAILVFVNGSTASVSTIEYEPGLITDIKETLLSLFPREKAYKHNLTWNDGNGYSHIMATFMKPSILVPFVNKEPILGTWQQIILLDFDNKPRKREIIVKILS